MPRVSFHRLARKELIEAATYYEGKSGSLGSSFLDAVQRATESIREFPDSAPTVHATVRKKLVKRFPYALLYSSHPDSTRILAVMNLKRRPMYWVGRE